MKSLARVRLAENMDGLNVPSHTEMFLRIYRALELHCDVHGYLRPITVYSGSKPSMPNPFIVITCMLGTGQYQVSMNIQEGDKPVKFKTNNASRVIARIISGS